MTQPLRNPDRKTGKVTRIGAEFGFIAANDAPDEGLYFKISWFQGNPPLEEGEMVSFEVRRVGDKPQAHYIRRVNQVSGQARIHKTSHRQLMDWAYLGYIPATINRLKELALAERWTFQNKADDPEHPHPILFSYLTNTFGRLALEEKIIIKENPSIAAFNTGLVDRRYEPIYALFTTSGRDSRTPWKLEDFCVAGEGRVGQQLVRYFNPLPPPAHYFDTPSDLFYDVRAGKPELSWRHIIIENIDRFPKKFLEDNCPPRFQLRDTFEMSDEEYNRYSDELGRAVEDDNRTYRSIMNRFKDALDLSIKRASWNFKTAIPQYYPRVKALTLLLPICLVSDDQVDMALSVEKTPSGNYLGHTILLLDWAYKNARLVCRPDSDWLVPDNITEGIDEPTVQTQTEVLSQPDAPTRQGDGLQEFQPSATKLCPVCGVPMEMKTVPSGELKGKQFFVCPNYDECKQVVPAY
jgi:cold shock CspA family protein